MTENVLDPVTRYYKAAAKHRRQLNRFFSGPVGSWRSPWEIGGDGLQSSDSGLAASRAEFDAAIVALSETQREKHHLNLSAEQVKQRDYDRAVKAARGAK